MPLVTPHTLGQSPDLSVLAQVKRADRFSEGRAAPAPCHQHPLCATFVGCLPVSALCWGGRLLGSKVVVGQGPMNVPFLPRGPDAISC